MKLSSVYFRCLWSAAAALVLTPALASAELISCNRPIALDCPQSYVDGCIRRDNHEQPLTRYHACVPDKREGGQLGCELEVAILCQKGEKDACLFTPALGNVHVCVLESSVTP